MSIEPLLSPLPGRPPHRLTRPVTVGRARAQRRSDAHPPVRAAGHRSAAAFPSKRTHFENAMPDPTKPSNISQAHRERDATSYRIVSYLQAKQRWPGRNGHHLLIGAARRLSARSPRSSRDGLQQVSRSRTPSRRTS